MLLRQEHVDDRVAGELTGHTSLAALQRYSHIFSEEPGRAVASLRLEGL